MYQCVNFKYLIELLRINIGELKWEGQWANQRKVF